MTIRGDGQDDADLRQAFALLRRQEADTAPAYEAVRARRVPRRLAPLGGLLAAASVILAVLGIVASRPDPPPMAAIGQWIAPTDFLLDTPGREFIQTVPEFGIVPKPRSVSP